MDVVKTTIDIPEALYRKAKIRAAKSGSTLRDLVVGALETSLNSSPKLTESTPRFRKGQMGFPILPSRKGEVVTDELINRIREEEGI